MKGNLILAAGAAAIALTAGVASSKELNLDDLPDYRPERPVVGTIRICGHGFEKPLVQTWEAAFQGDNPGVRFENTLFGTAPAIPAAALGYYDMAIIGREISHLEMLSFWRGKKRVPVSVKVTQGTYSIHGDAATPGAFVNKANPINGLTLTQLDAILGSEHLRGAPRNIRRWGDLGLTGEWADKVINIYGNWLDDGDTEFIRQTVMLNSNRWNAENYHEFWNDIETPDGTRLVDAGRNWITDKIVLGKILTLAGDKAVRALAADPFGIAITSVCYRDPGIRLLPIAVDENGPYVEATREHVFDGTYPIARSSNVYFDRTGKGPAEPAIREFLRFVLSRQGQQIVLDCDMMPLNAQRVREELQKLN